MKKLTTKSSRERQPVPLKRRRQHHLLDVRVRAHIATAQRNRRVMTWICGLIVVSAVSFGTIYGVRAGLRKLLWENPKYRVQEIAVSDDGTLSRERVVAVSGVRKGESIFSVNLDGARTRLEKLSQIARVDVRRIWPDKIEIAVNERKPVAWVTKSGAAAPETPTMMLDERGVLFCPESDALSKFDLPVISGVASDEFKIGETLNTMTARAALNLLLLNSGNPHLQISAIDVSKGYCLVVSDRHHAQILFGLENIDRELDRLSLLMKQIAPTKREVKTVNLLVRRNIPVTFFSDDATSANGDLSGSGPATASAASSPLAKPETTHDKKTTEKKRVKSHSKEHETDHRKPTKRAVLVRRAQPVKTD